MKKQLYFLLLFSVWYFISAGNSFAARNIYITSDKSNLENNDELIVTASTSGFTNGEKIYIKGAFFKEGSSNYFGLTKFNNDWVKNSSTVVNQREIIIGSWDNLLITKPDFEDNGFTEPGEYRFKLGYYYLTSTGNISSINWSTNQINIKINWAPTKEPDPTSSNSNSSTTQSNINKSPTPTKIFSVTPSKYITKIAVIKNNEEFAKISRRTRTASEYAQIKQVTNLESKKKESVLGIKNTKDYVPILFLSGVVFMIAGFSQFLLRFLKEKINK